MAKKIGWLIKRAMEYSVWELFFDILIRITFKRVLIVGALAAVVFGALRVEQQFGVRAILRDAFVAVYADRMAGERVELEGVDYTLASPYPPGLTWGIEVNSLWLLEQSTYIVPYFASELIAGNPQYPDAAYFLPREGASSFTVGGQMFPESWLTGGGWLQVNERYLTDPHWIDGRAMFGTLVHELTHVQGGVFILGSSAELESATVAATTEMLAAMCIFQNDLACGSFWNDVSGHAMVSLSTRLPEPVYDAFLDLFIRDAEEAFADKKTDRFWANNEATRQMIREKYGRHPWEERILPGVLYGWTLDTKISAPDGDGYIRGGYMPYDDTSALMGWRLRLLLWLTTR